MLPTLMFQHLSYACECPGWRSFTVIVQVFGSLRMFGIPNLVQGRNRCKNPVAINFKRMLHSVHWSKIVGMQWQVNCIPSYLGWVNWIIYAAMTVESFRFITSVNWITTLQWQLNLFLFFVFYAFDFKCADMHASVKDYINPWWPNVTKMGSPIS